MDVRLVVLLLMMANHQKQNMRDHLLAVQELVAAAPLRRLQLRSAYPRQQAFACKTPRDVAIALAERVGFEPTVPVTAHTLSKRAPSAARPPLRCVHSRNSGGSGGEGGIRTLGEALRPTLA